MVMREYLGSDLPSFCKQSENWTKYIRQKFWTLGKKQH